MCFWAKGLFLSIYLLFQPLTTAWAKDGGSVWYTYPNGGGREKPQDEITFSPALHSFKDPDRLRWTIFIGFDGVSVPGSTVPLYRVAFGKIYATRAYLEQEVEVKILTIMGALGSLYYGIDWQGAASLRQKFGLSQNEYFWVSGHNLKVERK